MVVTTLFQFNQAHRNQSILGSKKRWFTSVAIAVLATFASSATALAEQPTRLVSSAMTVTVAQSSSGIYLYGESDRPDIIGKEYIILEKIGTKTIGAFYLPRSEFSCFYGQFKGSRLNVTLIDTFDRQKYNFSLGINPNGLTASKQPMMGEPTYQPLDKISNNDRQILTACKLKLQNQH
jgi:hypothetical protein